MSANICSPTRIINCGVHIFLLACLNLMTNSDGINYCEFFYSDFFADNYILRPTSSLQNREDPSKRKKRTDRCVINSGKKYLGPMLS